MNLFHHFLKFNLNSKFCCLQNFGRKSEGKKPIVKTRLYIVSSINTYLEYCVELWSGFDPGGNQVAHACDQVNEISSSVKDGDTYDQLCDYFLVKKKVLLHEVSSFVAFLVAAAADVIHCNNKLWTFNIVNNRQPAI